MSFNLGPSIGAKHSLATTNSSHNQSVKGVKSSGASKSFFNNANARGKNASDPNTTELIKTTSSNTTTPAGSNQNPKQLKHSGSSSPPSNKPATNRKYSQEDFPPSIVGQYRKKSQISLTNNNNGSSNTASDANKTDKAGTPTNNAIEFLVTDMYSNAKPGLSPSHQSKSNDSSSPTTSKTTYLKGLSKILKRVNSNYSSKKTAKTPNQTVAIMCQNKKRLNSLVNDIENDPVSNISTSNPTKDQGSETKAFS